MTTRARKRLDLAAYQADVEDFSAAMAEETYANLAGLEPEMSLQPIYERHARLIEPGVIDQLRDLAAGDDETAQQASILFEFAVTQHVRAAAADLTSQIETAESRAIVVWRGDRIPYRSVPSRVDDLTGRAERNALDASYHEAVEAINPLREERLRRMRTAVMTLGYRDPVEVVRQAAHVDPDRLAAEMQAFLTDSETVYFAALRRYLALIDIEQGDATVADLRHVLRGRGWDHWFPARRAVPVLQATLAGLGIELQGQDAITLDVASRPTKAPRAFCAAVRVPQDVRLVVRPRGGWDDYAALLHQAGHAEHLTHVDPQAPVAYRRLGDDSVTEGYAALFEFLFLEPAWLEEHARMPAEVAAGFVDFAAFWRLYLLRRHVAQLLYELRLLRDPEPTLARAYYEGIVGLLTGVHTPAAGYLVEVEDVLYSARYVRSWLLEASLAEWLRGRHGISWWRSAEAGDSLRQAWSRGQRWRAEDVVAHLGYDRLDWRPILRQIRTRLIGEMSGYGGPNITTRAGTRKV